MEWIADPNAWVALATLAALEIVLGVDNIIFISILVGRLPEAQRARARTLGLALAAVTRIGLLLSITWVMSLTEPWFTIFGKDFSGRDIILLGGGLFLLWKSVHEIHGSLEGEDDELDTGVAAKGASSLAAIIGQIAVIDIVFSLDSVITAVGLVDEVEIMIIAILLAV
ncbi:MAG: Integral rane protein TerC, partial [Betaproteobacteria bacterium]|nr:Integral rane protein TerC [Betaproteobacteria bacterium]